MRLAWGKLLAGIIGTISCACWFAACDATVATPPSTAAPMAAVTAPMQQPSSEATAQQTLPAAPTRVVNYTYEVVKSYPHDPSAFTQGLVYHQGMLYESTGLNNRSSLRRVELESGRVLKQINVPGQYFAEGLVLWDGKFLQLTWQNQVGFIYDFNSFDQLATFNYQGEGWGITHDTKSLIMSNGSNELRFLDPNTYQVQRTVAVLERNRQVRNLNELEYVNGSILANIWLTDRIVEINPANGAVTGSVDLSGLLSPADNPNRSADVLNGIAYDAAGDRLFVTGKLWPKLYEIKLKARGGDIKRQ